MKVLKILSVKHFKCGYELRREIVDALIEDVEAMEWTAAYTPSGDYIGDPKMANMLVAKRGIQPILSKPGNNVCSIGYSVKDGKWYGWSHRAAYGFKVGSTCKKGHCHYVPKRHKGKGAWTAKTTADAKQMAIDFAESVS